MKSAQMGVPIIVSRNGTKKRLKTAERLGLALFGRATHYQLHLLLRIRSLRRRAGSRRVPGRRTRGDYGRTRKALIGKTRNTRQRPAQDASTRALRSPAEVILNANRRQSPRLPSLLRWLRLLSPPTRRTSSLVKILKASRPADVVDTGLPPACPPTTLSRRRTRNGTSTTSGGSCGRRRRRPRRNSLRASAGRHTLALAPSGALVILPWLFKNVGSLTTRPRLHPVARHAGRFEITSDCALHGDSRCRSLLKRVRPQWPTP